MEIGMDVSVVLGKASKMATEWPTNNWLLHLYVRVWSWIDLVTHAASQPRAPHAGRKDDATALHRWHCRSIEADRQDGGGSQLDRWSGMLFHGKLHQLASYHTILYTGHQATRTCASSYIMRGPNLCDEMTTSLVTRSHKQFIRVTLAHFVTQSVIIPWPRIIFLWRKLSFPLHIHSAIIHIIIYFERIITDIIILWNEKKDMYYFLKINEIIAWWKKN